MEFFKFPYVLALDCSSDFEPKVHLHYETITSQNKTTTSQNVLAEALAIFLFHSKVMFCSQEIQVFVF